MPETNKLARSLQELGLAAWFGGSLMGAIGVNGAAAQVQREEERALVASAGWSRWTPVNLVAIGAYLTGSTLVTVGNKSRIAGQKGVATTSVVKTSVIVAALGATAYSRALGQKVIKASPTPVSGGTEPTSGTPDEVADAQRKLRMLQWAVPALTGTLVVLASVMGEQQRASQVASGVAQRILPSALTR
ncbi:MAG: hypothetical protein M3179_12320 [Actinomycetota bacterium]|nr:hypothetical protein [Actinomycetota bacterium]